MSELNIREKRIVQRDVKLLNHIQNVMNVHYKDHVSSKMKYKSTYQLVQLLQSKHRTEKEFEESYAVLFHRVVDMFDDFLLDQSILPRTTMKVLDKSINKYVKLKYISEGSYGRVFALKVKGMKKQILILKTSKDDSVTVDFLHETCVNAILTDSALNIYQHIPKFFLPTFLAGIRKEEFSNRDPHICILQEQLPKAQTVFDFIVSTKNKDKVQVELIMIFLQVMAFLAQAQAIREFVHYDLHTSNVLVQKSKTTVSNSYKLELPNGKPFQMDLQYKYHAFIIDFGFSVAKYNDTWYTPVSHGGKFHRFIDNQFSHQPYYPLYDFINFTCFIIRDLLYAKYVGFSKFFINILLAFFEHIDCPISDELNQYLQRSLKGEMHLELYGSNFMLSNSKANKEMCSCATMDEFLHFFLETIDWV